MVKKTKPLTKRLFSERALHYLMTCGREQQLLYLDAHYHAKNWTHGRIREYVETRMKIKQEKIARGERKYDLNKQMSIRGSIDGMVRSGRLRM